MRGRGNGFCHDHGLYGRSLYHFGISSSGDKDCQNECFLWGAQRKIQEVLDGLGILDQIWSGHRYETRLEALRKAAEVDNAT